MKKVKQLSKTIARPFKWLWKHMEEPVGFMLFILLLIVMSPALFISGGLLRIKRYFMYVSAVKNNKQPKKYYW